MNISLAGPPLVLCNDDGVCVSSSAATVIGDQPLVVFTLHRKDELGGARRATLHYLSPLFFYLSLPPPPPSSSRAESRDSPYVTGDRLRGYATAEPR